MGLATGIELKTKPVVLEDEVITAPLEELKTVIKPVETTSVPSLTSNVEAPDTAEVTIYSLTVSQKVLEVFFFTSHNSFCLDCPAAGSNFD